MRCLINTYSLFEEYFSQEVLAERKTKYFNVEYIIDGAINRAYPDADDEYRKKLFFEYQLYVTTCIHTFGIFEDVKADEYTDFFDCIRMNENPLCDAIRAVFHVLQYPSGVNRAVYEIATERSQDEIEKHKQEIKTIKAQIKRIQTEEGGYLRTERERAVIDKILNPTKY